MMRLTTREVLNREASCPSSNLGQCTRDNVTEEVV